MAESHAIDDLLEHAAFARRLARALVGDEARADDVVQQTWLNALEHPPRAGRGVKAWLATVVRNTASKLRRDESRREAREQEAATPEPLPSTAEVAAQLAAQRELLDAVARLDEPGRSTIHARFFEGRTPTEIALALGIPVRTVETRLRRAIERLRAELDDRVEGGRKAWVGLLVGGSVVAIKTKSASAIGITALLVATAATVVVTITQQERADRTPIAAPAAAVSRSTRSAEPATSRSGLDDAAPAATTPTRAPIATDVTVVSPDGVGVAAAAVVLFRGEEVLGEATTDENGGASLPIQESPCQLFVFPLSAPAKVVEVAAKSTSLEVNYDEGALFSGHVAVDGGPPSAPVTFKLTAENDRFVWPVRVPDAVAIRVQRLRAATSFELAATTDRDGAFTFFGLAAHVPFAMHVPSPYEDATRGRTYLQFDEARADVEIALRFNPSIRGRVVDARGDPLAGWKVESVVGTEDECNSEAVVESDASGRFSVFVHEGRHRPTGFAVLFVCDPSGLFARSLRIAASVDSGYDAGDVAVDTRRLLTLDPRDESGRPIERFATVVERKIESHEMAFHSARDVVPAERSRSGLLLPQEASSLRVVAPGFGAADVKSEPAALPVKVTLPTAASLEIIVHDGDKAPAPEWTLELLASRWPAAWTREDISAAHVTFGGSPIPWNHTQDDESCPFRLGSKRDGRFTALAVRAGLPITLVVRDGLDVEVLREEIVLQPGEQRVVERALEHEASTLSGFVHDPEGRPLRVRIDVRDSGASRSQLAWSDEKGRFQIEGIHSERLTLLFEAAGHSSRCVQDVQVRGRTDELDVELKGGRSVRCGFVGIPGAPAPTAVWIEPRIARPHPEGSDLQLKDPDCIDGERDGDHRYRFADVPDGPLLLRARIDGFTFAYEVHPEAHTNYNAMVRGPVEIDWSIAPTTANGRTLTALRLLPLDRDGARATLPIDASDAARGSGLARIEKIAIDRYAVALVWSDASGQRTEEKSDVVIDVQRNESARVILTR